ncbi:MAG: LON peptidase substrate-binding domain-containing protein [Saprospiraceae bacterium]|nr:LON peptidase substrate-binding domain-containing protein [Saprospiraceae bacterium]
MSEILAQFPLKIVVFPGEVLNLHIFEPRYKQLILECENSKMTFGIVPFLNDEVQKFGTEMQLIEIKKKYDNGEMDIRTKAVGTYEIIDFIYQLENRLYPAAEIKRKLHDHDGVPEYNTLIINKIAELYNILNIKKEVPKDITSFSIYQIAHLIGLSLEQEYNLLSLATEKKRQEYVLSHMNKMNPMVKEMENLRAKVILNGHFKHLLPPDLRGK